MKQMYMPLYCRLIHLFLSAAMPQSDRGQVIYRYDCKSLHKIYNFLNLDKLLTIIIIKQNKYIPLVTKCKRLKYKIRKHTICTIIILKYIIYSELT